MCSSPPEFKGKSWTIYDEVGCFDDDYEYITDIAEEVEGIVKNKDKFLPNKIFEEYECNDDENSLPTGIQEKDTILNYKNDYVSFAVVAEFSFVYLVGLLWFLYQFLIVG